MNRDERLTRQPHAGVPAAPDAMARFEPHSRILYARARACEPVRARRAPRTVRSPSTAAAIPALAAFVDGAGRSRDDDGCRERWRENGVAAGPGHQWFLHERAPAQAPAAPRRLPAAVR